MLRVPDKDLSHDTAAMSRDVAEAHLAGPLLTWVRVAVATEEWSIWAVLVCRGLFTSVRKALAWFTGLTGLVVRGIGPLHLIHSRHYIIAASPPVPASLAFCVHCSMVWTRKRRQCKL